MTGPAVFVGRDQEIGRVAAALGESAMKGFVVAGDRGVGKTRFLEEAVRLARDQGYETARVAGTSRGCSISVGNVTHLVEASPGEDFRRGSPLPPSRLVGDPAGGRPVVLVADDTHLLNEASAALIGQLVHSPLPVFALVSFSTAARAPQVITQLWTKGMIERLELAPLTPADVDQLVRARLGDDLDGLTRQQLWEASGGDLSLHQELVTAGLKTDALRATDDVWSWHGPLLVTSRLVELTWCRIGPVGKEHVRALELCAIACPVGIEDVGHLIPPDVLEDLEARRVLFADRVDGSTVLRFRFPVDALVLRTQIPELRARRHRLDLADEGDRHAPLQTSVSVVSWRLDSDLSQPVETLIAATCRAPARHDPPFTRRLALAALEAGGGHQLSRLVAEAVLRGQYPEDAEAALDALARRFDGNERTWIHLGRAVNALIGRHHIPLAFALLEEAESSATCPDAQAESRSFRALLSAFRGANNEGLEWISTATSDGSSSVRALSIERLAHAMCLTAMDRPVVALAILRPDAAAPLDREQLAPLLEWVDELILGVLLSMEGRLAEAADHSASAYARAVQCGEIFAIAMTCGIQSFVARAAGNADRALRFAREGRAMARHSGSQFAQSLLLSELALSSVMLGDVAGTIRSLAQIEGSAHNGHDSFHPLCWQIDIAAGWVLLAQGDREAAVKHMLSLASRARVAESWAYEAVALHETLRMGPGNRSRQRLQELASGGGLATRLYAEHAAAEDGPALDVVADSFERSGYLLLAAEASAEASVAHRGLDCVALRCASAVRATQLAARCPGVNTPSLTMIEKPMLTKRELEIARLAMGALTNREIATRLVVSVRTVENHLQRVYGKVGSGDRSQLLQLVGPFVRSGS